MEGTIDNGQKQLWINYIQHRSSIAMQKRKINENWRLAIGALMLSLIIGYFTQSDIVCRSFFIVGFIISILGLLVLYRAVIVILMRTEYLFGYLERNIIEGKFDENQISEFLNNLENTKFVVNKYNEIKNNYLKKMEDVT